MRPIDGDNLKRKVQKVATEAWKMKLTARVETVLNQCIDYIDNAPTIEPEIVKCKDCKWYELPSHKITENCVRWMKSNGILLPIKPNDYCSYAERRTDD